MKKTIFLTALLGLFLVSTAIADPGDMLWNRTYGGSQPDWGQSVQQTTDGGYIVAGITDSFGAGPRDVYLVKTDASGNTQWTRTYGGMSYDRGYSVQQTSDGGYIVAGWTQSPSAGGWDFYLVKTDAGGHKRWSRTYGGSRMDVAYSVQQTTDGGYIIAGESQSFGVGDPDIYLVKTDADGGIVWTRTYGGRWKTEYGRCVQQTSDGGYIIAGMTDSFGAGGQDFYLVKTDADGDTLWTRAYGGSRNDYAHSVQQTTDGGYIMAGRTYSFGPGYVACYLVKTDAGGNTLWTRTYGGSLYEEAFSVQQTSDGGYILAGVTESFGAGGYDFYLVKTDANGDTLWTRAYGGNGWDHCYSVQQTTDGGYILTGITGSFGAGGHDVWLVRVAGEAPPDVAIEILPDDPPVIVPQGGSFGFTGSVTNNTEDPQVTDVWIMAVGLDPLGYYWGPFKEFHGLELDPLETLSGHFNQHVPNRAPLGFYNYIAYCGEYPSTVMDSSFFELEVIAGQFTETGEAGWILTGSFLEGDLPDLPSEFTLLSNYPNPFNAQTVIEYQLPTSSTVKLEIYNLFGQKVATLVDTQQEAGYRSVTWEDSEAASGVYFYKLTAGDFTEVKRMTLLR